LTTLPEPTFSPFHDVIFCRIPRTSNVVEMRRTPPSTPVPSVVTRS
jgi:hypothetical protein